jgi:hypothetical protein
VIHVIAVITAQGESMTSSTEQTETAPVTATSEPKATKKARAGARRARVAPAQAKSAKKARPPKKAPKGAKKASGARGGSKTAKVLDLLKRTEGATLKELMNATGWQAHSVRGFLSGTLGKKMGLKVTSTRTEDKDRNYSLKG